MKIKITLPDQNEALANQYSMPDQLAGRLSQQTEPSDEELQETKKREKEEEREEKLEKAKEGKKDDKDKKPDSDGESKDDDADADDADADDADADDADDLDADDLDADDTDDGDGGDEGEDDESDTSEDDPTEDDDGAGDSDSPESDEGDDGADSDAEDLGDDDESEEDGPEASEDGDSDGESDADADEDEETPEEAVAASGPRRIYRGTASDRKVIVICGFPGVGKTTALKQFQGHYNVVDLDSSDFPKDDFPRNYVEHIKEVVNSGKYDLCFVSSHAEVRAALRAQDLHYLLAYPARISIQQYLSRYIKRGSPTGFVDLMIDKWDEFIDSCEDDPSDRVVLKPDEFLSDYLEKLLS